MRKSKSGSVRVSICHLGAQMGDRSSSLSVPHSVNPLVCQSVSQLLFSHSAVSQSFSQPVYQSISPLVCQSIIPLVCQSFSPSVFSASVCQSLSFVSLSVRQFFCASVCQSVVCQSVSLSVSQSINASIKKWVS